MVIETSVLNLSLCINYMHYYNTYVRMYFIIINCYNYTGVGCWVAMPTSDYYLPYSYVHMQYLL